mgnify:CR=1 FL=1
MFIEEDPISISIFFKKVGRHFIAYSKPDYDKMELSEEERSLYKELTLQMRPLTWGLYNELQESAMVLDELGNRQFNYKVYKENRLLRLIRKWNAKRDGKDVPINPTTLSKLSPDIAEVILTEYDNVSLLDEDDEKK